MSPHDSDQTSELPSELKWEDVRMCPLCEGTSLANWRQGCSDSTGLPGSLTYLRCATCNCRTLSQRPDEASIALLYGHNYGPYTNKLKVTNMAVVGGAGRDDSLRTSLGTTYGRPAAGARVLDFGCGSSDFVDAARQAGWNTVAADFTETGISGPRANGHEVRMVDSEFWSWLQDERFDVVRLSHVIEHLHRPRRQLRQFMEALARGGRLHVITPNPEGPACTFTRRHSNFFQWVHVTLIPPNSLAQAALSIGATSTDIVLEPTTKDLYRSWLLTTGRVRSYETAPLAPNTAIARQLLGGVSRVFARRGRADRYHAFIRA